MSVSGHPFGIGQALPLDEENCNNVIVVTFRCGRTSIVVGKESEVERDNLSAHPGKSILLIGHSCSVPTSYSGSHMSCDSYYCYAIVPANMNVVHDSIQALSIPRVPVAYM